MKIIKRNKSEAEFDGDKIKIAITKANDATPLSHLSNADIDEITNKVINKCFSYNHTLTIEDIQNIVENELMNASANDVAKNYITYRYQRMLDRNTSTLEDKIMSIVELKNEEVFQENSNKNPVINSTQRDYIAGEVSRDISMKKMFSKEAVAAHNKGIIHIHDTDYLIQPMHNCDLLDLEDMLQNGTIISNTLIETPKSFSTACNIATQIVAQVASNQYGGQTITLTHLAPFVDVSRQKIRKLVNEEFKDIDISDEKKEELVEKRVKDEVKKGVQTIQYQVLTLLTTNGQTPFISICMYLNEAKDQRTKDDLAMIIEEMLIQRIQGVKNEKGVWITPAFPKLLYILEEDNIKEDGKYYYLTELAAKCSAKRMVPDYISEKKMLEYKIDKNGNGNCFPCMGCVDGQEVITYKFNNKLFVESFERMWSRMSMLFQVKPQYNIIDNPNLVIELSNVQIYDTKISGFTNCKRIIRNISSKWIDINFSNGRRLLCTDDHPLEILNKGIVQAKNIDIGDSTICNIGQFSEEKYNINPEFAWTLGIILCDGCYNSRGNITVSLGYDEEDIIDKYIKNMKNLFNIDINKKLQTRGDKGTYYDLISIASNYTSNLNNYLTSIFEGVQKIYRHIPNEVFEWNYDAKLAFLAGMIDADGYINNTKSVIVQLGSTNKELAIQQMLLAQSCGMISKLYYNHYNYNEPGKIRYRIEFIPSMDLNEFINCNKKKNNIKFDAIYFEGNKNHNYSFNDNRISVVSKREINETKFSYDVTTDSEHFEVSGIYSHNCRSFLTPYIDENGKPKYYGRFNQGVVTINLPYIALLSQKDETKFWEELDKYLELCHDALMAKHNRLEGTISDVAPILWQYGALARLKKGEKIDKLLYGGYSTISLGYAGLYECVKYMTGKSHTDEDAKSFALSVMQRLNDKCTEWKEKHNIDFSVYGSPIESVTYKFAKANRDAFGEIEDITNHNYVTNSYHVSVRENIDAFTKLAFESEFQKLSPGGAISYVEVPNMQDNIPAVIEVIKFIYENIMYAEINTKSDYCMECGYDGEIQIVEDNKKLVWECPNCGNRDQNKMSVARRTCGYVGTNFWNQGRTEEIKERVLHL